MVCQKLKDLIQILYLENIYLKKKSLYSKLGTYLSENLEVASELETKIRQKEMGEATEKEADVDVES